MHKPSGYSDLSTNSRSSLNNTFVKKRQLTPSEKGVSNDKLKRLVNAIPHRKSTNRINKTEDFESINRQATLLIERSVNNSRYQVTPNRRLNIENTLDLSGARLVGSSQKRHRKQVKPNNIPFPLKSFKLKRNKAGVNSISIKPTDSSNVGSLQNSTDTALSYLDRPLGSMFVTSSVFKSPMAFDGPLNPFKVPSEIVHSHYSTFGNSSVRRQK